MIKKLFFLLIVSLILSHCTMQKRLYRKGIYIEHLSNVKHKRSSSTRVTENLMHREKISNTKTKHVIPKIQSTQKDSNWLVAAAPSHKHVQKNMYHIHKTQNITSPIFHYYNSFQHLKIPLQDSLYDEMKIKKLKKQSIKRLVIATILAIPTIGIYYYHFFYTLLYFPMELELIAIWGSIWLLIEFIMTIILLFKIRKYCREEKYKIIFEKKYKVIKIFAWAAFIINLLSWIFLLIPVILKNYIYWI